MRASTVPLTPARPVVLASVIAATLWFALFATLGAAPVAAGGELAIQKYVAAVNDAAPSQGESVRVVEGDTVAYGLAVSSSPSLAGTTVTVTDVFGANALSFENASVEACGSAGDEISCTLDLDDQGAAEVTLTFSVLPMDAGAEGCQALVNRASVEAEDGTTATSQAQIEVCAPDSEASATGEAQAAPSTAAAPSEAAAPASSAAPAAGGSGTHAAATAVPAASGGATASGGTGETAGTSVDTAVSPPTGVGAALLIQLGVLLLGGSALVLAHVPANRRR